MQDSAFKGDMLTINQVFFHFINYLILAHGHWYKQKLSCILHLWIKGILISSRHNFMMGDPMYSLPTSSGNRWHLLLYVESRSLSKPNILSYLSRAILHLTLSQRRQSYSSALVIRIHQKQIHAWHTDLGLCNDSKSREGCLVTSLLMFWCTPGRAFSVVAVRF